MTKMGRPTRCVFPTEDRRPKDSRSAEISCRRKSASCNRINMPISPHGTAFCRDNAQSRNHPAAIARTGQTQLQQRMMAFSRTELRCAVPAMRLQAWRRRIKKRCSRYSRYRTICWSRQLQSRTVPALHRCSRHPRRRPRFRLHAADVKDSAAKAAPAVETQPQT